MSRPRKSTFDAFVDQFCGFPIADQERALELMNFEHRRAKFRAASETKAAKGETRVALREPQPAVGLLDGVPESEAIR